MDEYIMQHTGEQLDSAIDKALNPDTAPTSDSSALITSGAVAASLANKVNSNLIGAANGVAGLDANGKVPSAQIPKASKTGTITTTTTWNGSDPYYQTVTVSSVTITANSKVDIQPSATQLAQLISDGVQALVVENNSGTLTLYAIGAMPSTALTIQAVVTEVES